MAGKNDENLRSYAIQFATFSRTDRLIAHFFAFEIAINHISKREIIVFEKHMNSRP